MEIERYLTQEELDRIVSELRTPEEVDLFLRGLEEMFIEGRSVVKEELEGVDWVERPVDMQTFLRDPYYLGVIDYWSYLILGVSIIWCCLGVRWVAASQLLLRWRWRG